MTKPTIKLVSNHRIDPEKGWGLILGWLQNLLCRQDLSYGIHYDIYGDGKMKEQVLALANRYPDAITYHGFVPIHQIFSGPMDYDFVLMPSVFLETFGLSALDFAQFGIPVIGYKKGGVAPFILDNLNISAYSGNTEQEQFDRAMYEICSYAIQAKQGQVAPYRVDKDEVVRTYSTDAWLKQFNMLVMTSGKP